MKPISLLLKKEDIEADQKNDTKEASWKEPFPNRIGKNFDGGWTIPNVTTTSVTSFAANSTSKDDSKSAKTESDSSKSLNVSKSPAPTIKYTTTETKTSVETTASAV